MLDNLYFIKSSVISSNIEKGDAFQNAVDFCKQWTDGQENFTINTSGSTGKPKPIKISRIQMEASAKMTIGALSLQKNDNALVCLNTSYIAGKMMLVRGMVSHLNMYITEPSSNPLVHVPNDLEIDFMALVPLQLDAIFNGSKDEVDKLNKMKAVIVGGAPISRQLSEKIKQLRCPIYATYGMTETVSHIALKRLNGDNSNPFYHLLDRVKIGQDDRGCLTINSILTNHETILTNDVVNLINEKEFEWLGRADLVINSGGVKIHPEQTEDQIKDLLIDNQWITNLILIGLPDEQLGEKVVLLLEGIQRSKFNLESLRCLLSSTISTYSVPKEFYVMDEFIYTETGKVNRKQTTDLLES